MDKQRRPIKGEANRDVQGRQGKAKLVELGGATTISLDVWGGAGQLAWGAAVCFIGKGDLFVLSHNARSRSLHMRLRRGDVSQADKGVQGSEGITVTG